MHEAVRLIQIYWRVTGTMTIIIIILVFILSLEKLLVHVYNYVHESEAAISIVKPLYKEGLFMLVFFGSATTHLLLILYSVITEQFIMRNNNF